MTQTNPGNDNNLCTSLNVQTSDGDPINCQKNDDKDPPRGSSRRRGNIRVSANDSVWGVKNLRASPRASPRDRVRNRRRSIIRSPKGMSGEEIHKLTNLMRFISNNRAERVTLLQIAMAPSQVCYRSHNSLSHSALGGSGTVFCNNLPYLQARTQSEKDALCDFMHKRLKGA